MNCPCVPKENIALLEDGRAYLEFVFFDFFDHGHIYMPHGSEQCCCISCDRSNAAYESPTDKNRPARAEMSSIAIRAAAISPTTSDQEQDMRQNASQCSNQVANLSTYRTGKSVRTTRATAPNIVQSFGIDCLLFIDASKWS